MTHQEKLMAMHEHMKRIGVSRSTAAPPAWQLLWRLGIEVPPPLFLSFLSITLVMGTVFGLFWGLLMWVILWARQGVPLGIMATGTLVAGALFGLAMAAWLRHLARKHNLPSWAEYTGAPPVA
ncbi:hypothetical protein CSC70_01940 [Pseudoxanthomonas kalamensis DSM 18571]|uniref:DUF6404 family protein n=1 Tax=Pseudoxanthomonas kalamensis TaxID=289483 RepID=UPI001391293E|nr:DUF6404 family protein [Pseudoxanthomonas kalamensis]KAF1712309.1 hypothetical protein CSC70_01940 [Pseudoxanthomonas kalamensis DSM 18571]